MKDSIRNLIVYLKFKIYLCFVHTNQKHTIMWFSDFNTLSFQFQLLFQIFKFIKSIKLNRKETF